MQSHLRFPEELADTLARYADAVHAEMRRALDAYATPRDFYDMMRYHLGWVDERFEPIAAGRGKGLRAALLLLLNEALGGDTDEALPFAAAVELLHNFSLVHDDIEDGSATRRHRPTVWSVWGTPLAINLGDGLFEIAHLTRYRSPLKDREPALFVEVMERFERAALTICEGQHLDMTFERLSEVSVASYLRMIDGKTATLIAASAWIGVRAAGAPAEAAEAACRFGKELGLAFQIQDDVLGIWGNEALTGKSASSDIATRKKTLPVLLAQAHAAPELRERLRALYAQPDGDGASIAEILALLNASGARELAEEAGREHWQAAQDALDGIGLSTQARDRLGQFANLFVERLA